MRSANGWHRCPAGGRAVDERRPAAEARLDIARAEMLDRRNYVARRLMRAFPQMKNHRYEAAMEQLKDWLKEKKRIRSPMKTSR